MPELPLGWREEPLGEVAAVRVSNVDKKSRPFEIPVRLCNYLDAYREDYLDESHPYMAGTATPLEVTKFGLRVGDVLVTKDSETPDDIGVAAVIEAVPDNLVCGYHLAMVRPIGRLNPVWLAKQFGTTRVKGYLAARATGSTRYGLSNATLANLPILVPLREEQDCVIEVLSALDEAIRRTEQLIAKLKHMKRGLLHDLLTRGIDDDGELRDPEKHPERFKKTELGPIPRTWNVCTLADLAINHDGRRIPLKQADRDKRHGPFPYYGASGPIDWIDDYLFEGDYVLLGEDGENVISRRSALAFTVSGRFWVNNHAHIYEPMPGVDSGFLTELLEATDYSRFVSGSAQPKLTQEGLGHVKFAVPLGAEQRRIASVLKDLDQRLSSERDSLAKAAALKQGVSEDLLTGHVRVTKLLERDAP
jgi:type I restriction enzyme S subunit